MTALISLSTPPLPNTRTPSTGGHLSLRLLLNALKMHRLNMPGWMMDVPATCSWQALYLLLHPFKDEEADLRA